VGVYGLRSEKSEMQTDNFTKSNEKYPWQNRGTGVRCHGYLGKVQQQTNAASPTR